MKIDSSHWSHNAYLTLKNGVYTAFAGPGRGYRESLTLPDALAFIREATGRTSGTVPCWDCIREWWGSEVDLSEAVVTS